MKATELRVNNWYTSVKFGVPVQCELTDFSQLDIMSDGAYNDPPIDEMFEPIALTEEWLLKFGYNKKNKSFTRMDKNREWYVVIENRKHSYLFKGTWMYYVHQLQNLHFALTGEELTIK